jgi:hypothetical protein
MTMLMMMICFVLSFFFFLSCWRRRQISVGRRLFTPLVEKGIRWYDDTKGTRVMLCCAWCWFGLVWLVWPCLSWLKGAKKKERRRNKSVWNERYEMNSVSVSLSLSQELRVCYVDGCKGERQFLYTCDNITYRMWELTWLESVSSL